MSLVTSSPSVDPRSRQPYGRGEPKIGIRSKVQNRARGAHTHPRRITCRRRMSFLHWEDSISLDEGGAETLKMERGGVPLSDTTNGTTS